MLVDMSSSLTYAVFFQIFIFSLRSSLSINFLNLPLFAILIFYIVLQYIYIEKKTYLTIRGKFPSFGKKDTLQNKLEEKNIGLVRYLPQTFDA